MVLAETSTGRQARPMDVKLKLLDQRCRELEAEVKGLAAKNLRLAEELKEQKYLNDELRLENKRMVTTERKTEIKILPRPDHTARPYGTITHNGKRHHDLSLQAQALDSGGPVKRRLLSLGDGGSLSRPVARFRHTPSLTTGNDVHQDAKLLAGPLRKQQESSRPKVLTNYWQIQFQPDDKRVRYNAKYTTKSTAWKQQNEQRKNFLSSNVEPALNAFIVSNEDMQTRYPLHSTYTKRCPFPKNNGPLASSTVLTDKLPIKVSFLLFMNMEHVVDASHNITIKLQNVKRSTYRIGKSDLYEYKSQRNGTSGLRFQTTLWVLFHEEELGSLRVIGTRMHFRAINDEWK